MSRGSRYHMFITSNIWHKFHPFIKWGRHLTSSFSEWLYIQKPYKRHHSICFRDIHISSSIIPNMQKAGFLYNDRLKVLLTNCTIFSQTSSTLSHSYNIWIRCISISNIGIKKLRYRIQNRLVYSSSVTNCGYPE